MITGELKSQIDRIWDAFWTGGIANPLEVIEQITYLLFARRLDDLHTAQERKANRLNRPIEKAVFPDGKLENGIAFQDLRWSRFKNLESREMYRVVSEGLFPFIRNLKGNGEGSTYARHMRDARFTIPTPALLARVVELIDKVPMEDRDTKGDLYEYMLSKIASAGTNGQFRTPRHIIQLMVEMIAPKPGDIICDPACGTAGFLVAAAEYLHDHHSDLFNDPAKTKHFNETAFHGFDFDSTMLRIGSMNMLLHGIENPDIRYKDSLSEEHADEEEKYTLVLANPPFAGSLDYEATAKDLLRVVKTKKTELLFMALFLRLLRPGGRAAVIVPDGVLFGSSNAHRELRRMLVEDQKLDAVISLPSGVFKPYAGVSTAILLFTKTNSGGTDHVWFYDVKADGMSLDDKRTELNDYSRMKTGKWKTAALNTIASIERSTIQPDAIGKGTPYLGLEHIEAGGRILEMKPVDKGELASSKFKFTQRHVLYGKLRPYLAKIACPGFDGICSTDILPILPGPDLDRRFLCYFLRQPDMVDYANARASGANLPRLSPSALAEFEIPLPPMAEQRRIAEVLDHAEDLRAKRRDALVQLDDLTHAIFLDLFGDPVSNAKGWSDNTLLGEVADIVSGITKGRKVNNERVREVPYLAVANVQDRSLNLAAVKSIEATDTEIARYRLQPDDLVLTEGGDPDKLGRGTLWHGELPECIHQNHIFRVRITSDRITPFFANWLISSSRGKQYFLKSAKQTTGIASINMTQLRGFPLLIPPIELQGEFARRATSVEKLKSAQHVSLAEMDALFASLRCRAFRRELFPELSSGSLVGDTSSHPQYNAHV